MVTGLAEYFTKELFFKAEREITASSWTQPQDSEMASIFQAYPIHTRGKVDRSRQVFPLA